VITTSPTTATSNVNSFTTFGYIKDNFVDNTSDEIVGGQKTFTNDPIINNPNGGNAALLFKRNSVTTGSFFSLNTNFLIRQEHSNNGTNTELRLYDDYIDVNKPLRGVATLDTDLDSVLATKGYVDSLIGTGGGGSAFNGGTITNDLVIDSSELVLKNSLGQVIRFKDDNDNDLTRITSDDAINSAEGSAFILAILNHNLGGSVEHEFAAENSYIRSALSIERFNEHAELNIHADGFQTTKQSRVNFVQEGTEIGSVYNPDSTTMRIQRENSGAGGVTNITLRNDFIVANKRMESVATHASFPDNTLVTKGFLGSIATMDIWQGTQAAYDALGSYDSNTLYLVE